jgi:hypothetical protein
MSHASAESRPVSASGDHIRSQMREAGVSASAGTQAERTHATARWLSAAAPSAPQAVTDWHDSGATWLRQGVLFTAVTVAASLMHQAVGRPGPQECAPLLMTELDGPAFYRLNEFGPDAGYTVLLPASAAGNWRVRGTVVLSSTAQLLIPAPDRLEPVGDAPWWVVPPDRPGSLCTPALLASLLARRGAPAGGEGDHA